MENGYTCRSMRRRPEIDPAKVRRRLEDALAVIAAVLETPRDHMVLKERRPQRGTAQYGVTAKAVTFTRSMKTG